MILGIRHTGLIVSNMSQSLRFYRDALGLTLLADYVQEGRYISRLTGIPRARVRMAKLGVFVYGRSQKRDLLRQPGMSGVIELLEFQRPKRFQHRRRTPGLSHIALAVHDIDGVYRNRKKTTLRFIYSPQVSPDGFAKVAYVRDPDGIVVELVQVLPASHE